MLTLKARRPYMTLKHMASRTNNDQMSPAALMHLVPPDDDRVLELFNDYIDQQDLIVEETLHAWHLPRKADPSPDNLDSFPSWIKMWRAEDLQDDEVRHWRMNVFAACVILEADLRLPPGTRGGSDIAAGTRTWSRTPVIPLSVPFSLFLLYRKKKHGRKDYLIANMVGGGESLVMAV
ncbi:hypothetical protein AJ80_08799 [Polytolypa hystricis UAMH7299]|uniref:Uncharacterized protein n=1 Tax=Polytolypa hystricis (strain UAMH7299) TaxID=1447883 RepID=A0A2B7X1U0_POLH7|nr:hypothetical protein AJ80_08799 [Polytolypa hystricis UAMH7299]